MNHDLNYLELPRSNDIPANILSRFSPGTYVDVLNAATLAPLFWGVVVDDPSYHSAGLIPVEMDCFTYDSTLGIPPYRLRIRSAIEALGELGAEQGQGG